MWYTLLSILLFVVGSFLLGLIVGRMRREVVTDDTDFQTSRRFFAMEKELDTAKRRISTLESERDRLLDAERIRRDGVLDPAAALSDVATGGDVDLSDIVVDGSAATPDMPAGGDIDLPDASADAAADLPDIAADTGAEREDVAADTGLDLPDIAPDVPDAAMDSGATVGIDLPAVDPHPVDLPDEVDLSEGAIDGDTDVPRVMDAGVSGADSAGAARSSASDSPDA